MKPDWMPRLEQKGILGVPKEKIRETYKGVGKYPAASLPETMMRVGGPLIVEGPWT